MELNQLSKSEMKKVEGGLHSPNPPFSDNAAIDSAFQDVGVNPGPKSAASLNWVGKGHGSDSDPDPTTPQS